MSDLWAYERGQRISVAKRDFPNALLRPKEVSDHAVIHGKNSQVEALKILTHASGRRSQWRSSAA